ncbi:uncharacterized protein TNCV_3985921 [Trichonephila clavipes]|nr:uncharacterized protein TNCV_3985921 [Trichonephila clavipes]
MTATAGSDVVQSGRPIFDDFFQHLWPYIGNNTANVVFQMVAPFVAYPHRPMTLHSPTENSLAVLNHKILEANSQVQNVVAVAEWYRYRTVACFVTGSSPVPLKTRRVGQRCTLNLSRAETSSRWCGVVVRRGGCQLRCRPRHLTMVQNYVVRRQKPSCS